MSWESISRNNLSQWKRPRNDVISVQQVSIKSVKKYSSNWIFIKGFVFTFENKRGPEFFSKMKTLWLSAVILFFIHREIHSGEVFFDNCDVSSFRTIVSPENFASNMSCSETSLFRTSYSMAEAYSVPLQPKEIRRWNNLECFEYFCFDFLMLTCITILRWQNFSINRIQKQNFESLVILDTSRALDGCLQILTCREVTVD